MISVILQNCICGGRRRARNTQNTLHVSRGANNVEPNPHLTCWAKRQSVDGACRLIMSKNGAPPLDASKGEVG